MPKAKDKVTLPDWASFHPNNPNKVIVDPDKCYPAIMEELAADQAARKADGKVVAEMLGGAVKKDQYWIEVAYQFAKMDLQVAMRKMGFEIKIRGDEGRKERWGHKALAKGRGLEQATFGKEARAHYKRLRGFIPG